MQLRSVNHKAGRRLVRSRRLIKFILPSLVLEARDEDCGTLSDSSSHPSSKEVYRQKTKSVPEWSVPMVQILAPGTMFPCPGRPSAPVRPRSAAAYLELEAPDQGLFHVECATGCHLRISSPKLLQSSRRLFDVCLSVRPSLCFLSSPISLPLIRRHSLSDTLPLTLQLHLRIVTAQSSSIVAFISASSIEWIATHCPRPSSTGKTF